METFENKNFKNINDLALWEYEDCNFIECDFSDKDFSNYIFINCEFKKCNLSMLKIINTTLSDIIFIDSKILWIKFKDSNSFNIELSFTNCILDFCDFFHLNLKWIKIVDSSLKEVNFIKSNLSEWIFNNCNLIWSIFVDTDLTKTNFITSYNYSLDPEKNKIKKTKFWIEWLRWLLLNYDIIVK